MSDVACFKWLFIQSLNIKKMLVIYNILCQLV
jgi:hypothetical protein